MRPHQNFDLWKRSVDFVVAIYRLTEQFPKEEKFGLTSQLRRAAVSVAANVAEGAAKNFHKRLQEVFVEFPGFNQRN